MKHFFKCFACLEPHVLESDSVKQPNRLKACPWCGFESMDYMGYVHQSLQVLAKEKLACPCDDRCTGAVGPNCDCQCGGANHGSNHLITIIEGQGPVPVIGKYADKAKLIRAEWEVMVESLKPVMNKAELATRIFYEKKRAGKWVPNEEYSAFRDADFFLKSCRKAIQGLVHKNRMTKMAKLRDGGFPLTKNTVTV